MAKNIQNKKTVLDMSSSEVRQFFIQHESYFNVEMPPYIDFNPMLKKVNDILNFKDLSSYYINNQRPRFVENINHIILHNKDGKYSWRPNTLIHPALYVSLVHNITKKNHWEIIRNRFRGFKKDKIKCASIPVTQSKKQKTKQILTWWEQVEQESIKMCLDYDYLIHIDIANCYGSLYTHSIPWALHGKDKIKKALQNNKKDSHLIGNIIDTHLKNISYGQTNGIPQGSVLMDFIAEMVLGYIDSEIDRKIKQPIDYFIIRYRDDYKIFTNSIKDGEKIIKIISEILIDFGMTLNPYKTKPSAEVVKDSIKPDKLHWIQKLYWAEQIKLQNLQKYLFIIHGFSMQFPNSGALIKVLHQYDKILGQNIKKNKTQRKKKVKSKKQNKKIKDVKQLISIITDIAYHNPRAYAVSAGMLSKLISHIDQKPEQHTILKKIKKKFKKIPNTGHLDIWLQRVAIGFKEQSDRNKQADFNELICKAVDAKYKQDDQNISIWKFDWLKGELRDKIKSISIVNKKS